MTRHPARIIAIDGPAASGKSTVARRVARALGDLYVDSGAVYRGITLAVLQRGVDPADENAVMQVLTGVDMEFFEHDGAVNFRLDGVEPGDALRTQEVNNAVSPVAALGGVRRQVVAWLQGLARLGNLVMEGRDIGTAVFPDTPLKFYLDASPEERARRRHVEMSDRGAGVDREAVDANLRRRDDIDSRRARDPLTVAPGANVVDSTGMEIEDVVAVILDRVKRGT